MVQRAVDLEVAVEGVVARREGDGVAEHGAAAAGVAATRLIEFRRYEQVAGTVEGSAGLSEAGSFKPAIDRQGSASAQCQVAGKHRRHDAVAARHRSGQGQRTATDGQVVAGGGRQAGDGMGAAVEHHAAAVVECDEHQIVQAGQGVAGPVGGIGPEGGSGTAVPADAAGAEAESDAQDPAGCTHRIACRGRQLQSADVQSAGRGQNVQLHAVRRACTAERNHGQAAVKQGASSDRHDVVVAGSGARELRHDAPGRRLNQIASDAQCAQGVLATRQ